MILIGRRPSSSGSRACIWRHSCRRSAGEEYGSWLTTAEESHFARFRKSRLDLSHRHLWDDDAVPERAEWPNHHRIRSSGPGIGGTLAWSRSTLRNSSLRAQENPSSGSHRHHHRWFYRSDLGHKLLG